MAQDDDSFPVYDTAGSDHRRRWLRYTWMPMVIGLRNQTAAQIQSIGTWFRQLSWKSDLSENLKPEYISFDGECVVRKDFPGSTVSYYLSDNLKTTSLISGSSGNIKEDENYYQQGGELEQLASELV